MNKKYLIIAILVIIVILGFIYLIQDNQNDLVVEADIISCLDNAGVVIYGSRTCPACASLVETFGGYVAMGSIYVECSYMDY